MECYFFELEADDGRRYCIAVKSKQFLMKATKNGTEPGELFGNFVGSSQKFLHFKEVSEDYILSHCQNGLHYVSMSKGVLSKEDSNFFWIS